MKKKVSSIVSFIAIALISLSSCEKYLDVAPEYTQDAENYFNTPEDYERALTGAYDLLQSSFVTLWIGEIASDNSIAGGESVTDTRGLHEIDNMTHNAVNDELRNIFRWNYAGIARCNYIMEYQDKLDFTGKDMIIAEVRFLRSYYYFELVKYFGAVPLVIDKRLGAEEVTQIDRTPAAEVYAQIEADLNAAIAVLDWSSPIKGRADKGAALGLLGKVYLYQDKFADAAQTLDQIIIPGQYSLIPDYSNLWTASNENNSETVFDVEYTGLEGGSYECFICLEGNAAAGFHGIRQYQGPVYGDGNSYNLPTEDLYNAFDTSDIRRDLSVLDLEAFIADQQNPNDISYAQGAGGHTGYYNNKYIKRKGEIGLPDDDLTSPLNYKVIRYADVLLMAAEAHSRSGDDGTAQTYLNLVRDRVNLPPVTASGQQLTEAIWAERRLELSGEGLRFFDLVRTGQAPLFIPDFVTGKHELFPIPQVEIDLAGGRWQQNSLY